MRFVIMLDLNSYFDKIYCVNLDRREDRWIETQQEFDTWNISNQIERFPAVDGNTIVNNFNINNGELGLIMTHQNILREAIAQKYHCILIIEDDIQFTSDILKLESYFKMLPSDWDMLWFGANHNIHCGNRLKLLNDKIIKCYNAFATHCIAFNHTIYSTVLNLINTKNKPVDVYYSELQQTHNCYAFNPSIAIQRPSYSDIQNQYQDNRWLF